MSEKLDVLMPSSKETTILELLRDNDSPLFGLELVQKSDGLLKRGTVYVTLQRMEEKGLVDSEQEPRPNPEIGIPRRRYRITGLGERALHATRAARNAFLSNPLVAEA